MSLDPVSQGQREDMIEDIHYHMEQVEVYDDLKQLLELTVLLYYGLKQIRYYINIK